MREAIRAAVAALVACIALEVFKQHIQTDSIIPDAVQQILVIAISAGITSFLFGLLFTWPTLSVEFREGSSIASDGMMIGSPFNAKVSTPDGYRFLVILRYREGGYLATKIRQRVVEGAGELHIECRPSDGYLCTPDAYRGSGHLGTLRGSKGVGLKLDPSLCSTPELGRFYLDFIPDLGNHGRLPVRVTASVYTHERPISRRFLKTRCNARELNFHS